MIARPGKSSASISRWKMLSACLGIICARWSTPSRQKAQPSSRATTSDCRPWKSQQSGESDSYNKCNGSHMAQSGGWLQLPTDTHFLLVRFNERGQFRSQLQMLVSHFSHAAVAMLYSWNHPLLPATCNCTYTHTHMHAHTNNNNTQSYNSVVVRTFTGLLHPNPT